MIEPPENLLPFLAARRDSMSFVHSYRRPFLSWQAELRAEWLDTLPCKGNEPMEVESSQSRLSGDLMLRHMRVRYATGSVGEAALLLPAAASRPLPAVVLCHDHGGSFDEGWRKMIDAGAEPARFYEGRYLGNELAKAGFAVLCIDALGWGSRNYGGYERQQALAYHALQLGWSLAGLVAADDLQSIAWLKEQPEIDPRRIGVMGFSHGSFRAWQAAGLHQDIAACVSLSWIGRRRDMLSLANPLLRGHSAYYFLHPAMALRADYPDMAGLAADRPLFIRTGDQDPHMPRATVQAAIREIEIISRDAGGLLDTAIFAGGHHCPTAVQQDAIAFLQHNL